MCTWSPHGTQLPVQGLQVCSTTPGWEKSQRRIKFELAEDLEGGTSAGRAARGGRSPSDSMHELNEKG